MTTRRSRRARGEDGDTLVEVLVAVTILGIAFVAILAGLGAAASLSGRHRGQTNASVVVLSAADSVKNQTYVSCPTASSSSYSPTSGVTLPSGWSATNLTVSAIQFRNGSAWQASCPSTDQSVQLVTVTATSPDGKSSQSVDVVKRKAT